MSNNILFYFSSKNDITKTKGSDTEVNLAVQFAGEFHKTNSEVLVSIAGEGAGLGIAFLINGNADIPNSSRSKGTELALFCPTIGVHHIFVKILSLSIQLLK